MEIRNGWCLEVFTINLCTLQALVIGGFVRTSPFIYSVVLVILLTAYMGLLLRYDEVAHLGMSALFFAGSASLLWERRHTLRVGSHWRDTVLGVCLIVLVLGSIAYLLGQYSVYASRVSRQIALPKSLTLWIRSLPLLSALGVSCIAFGLSRLKLVWRELAIMVALGLPGILAAYMVDVSPVTAQFSAALLWYTGFDVVREGVYLFLGKGGVEVYAGCSGLESMAYLFGLSGLCLIMFPLKGLKQYVIPVVGIIMGFVINGVRVALMTVLTAKGNKVGFDYWHTGDGSLLFGVIAVLAFGAFYMAVQTLEERLEVPKAAPTHSKQSALPSDLLRFLEQEDEPLS